MTDATPATDRTDRGADTDGIVAERYGAIVSALAARDREQLARLVADLKPRDVADIITALEPQARVDLIEALGPAFDVDALSEVDETVRDQLSEALPNAVIADAVRELDTDDAAYVIENLDATDQREILDQLSKSDRAAIERNLEYPEETAGRLMQADFVAVPPFWSVGQVIDHMREEQDLPDSFSDIFVVDASHHVLGSLDLSRLLRTKRHVAVADIMNTDRQFVPATADQEEMARQFERYGLKSAPVVDANQRLVGVVTVDDVVEVIEAEADEDIKRLAGVGDESLSDTVKDIAVQRFYWLFVNLLTAILASMVIKRFDTTIEQMVSLAVLMPIVASMGGNAGTQTMTVAVRALATEQLTARNVPQFVFREAAVGLANGLVFALIMATIAFFWFGSSRLGAVIGAAMVINLIAAACAGVFIPLALERYGFDPAVSSTVFVTTVTDVVGFLAFLGLAAFWLT